MGFFSSIANSAKSMFGGGGGDALGALVGGIVNTAGSAILANSANAKAKRAAEAQRAYETEMSNTAHQRQVEDLKAAHLNPVLSAMSQGASTPNSAIATADHIGEMQLGQGINSAIQYSIERQNADANTTTANSTKTINSAQAYKAYKDADAITKQTDQNIKESNAKILNIEKQRELMHAQLNETVTKTTILKGDNIRAYLKGNGIELTEKMIDKFTKKVKEEYEKAQKDNTLEQYENVEDFYNHLIKDI